MKPYSREYLSGRSVEELRAENLSLEAEQRSIRSVRLQLAEELDRRASRGQVPAEPQVVRVPELLVADTVVSGEPSRRRRWFAR